MIKVLFVCHGNICRSPMAEYVFKKMVTDSGTEQEFLIESAGTSDEEFGNPIYPPAKKLLNSCGIKCDDKHAKQIRREDYDNYDHLILMEEYNLEWLKRIIPDDPENKISMLMDHTERPGDVADPWYTGNFDDAWRDIMEGCSGLFKDLTGEEPVFK